LSRLIRASEYGAFAASGKSHQRSCRKQHQATADCKANSDSLRHPSAQNHQPIIPWVLHTAQTRQSVAVRALGAFAMQKAPVASSLRPASPVQGFCEAKTHWSVH